MVELWTAGWLEATRHRVASPGPGQAPRQSLVLFQAHDDHVKIRPLVGKQLVERQLEMTPKTKKEKHDAPNCRQRSGIWGTPHQSKAQRDHEDPPPVGNFAEWVRHRPAAILKKYPPTTQGAWVRKNEFKAMASLRTTADC